MIKKLTYILKMMAGVVCTMLAISACNEKGIEVIDPEWDKPADNTLLMYLVGDNSLSSLLEGNVRDAQAAIRDSVQAGTLNLVVMKDNDKSNDSKPVLYWVHGTRELRLDTVMIKRWEKDENTASADFLSEAIELTFSRFNTSIKGLSLGSHSSGWLPATNSKNAKPRRNAFGCDETPSPIAYLDTWDLGAALRKGPKLNYILMDCCHMALAEIAYELKDCADYMVGCPSEEEGAGLPYRKIITALSRCKSANDLPKTLDYCSKCYFDEYARTSYGATIAFFDLRQMDELGNAYKALLDSNSDRLKRYAEADGEQVVTWVKNFQQYGREEGGLHYSFCFYDILSVIDWLGATDAANATRARNAVLKAVVSKYSTDSYRGIKVWNYSGMAVSIPEVFHLAKKGSGYASYFAPYDDEKLLTGYHKTAWGSSMGY